MNDEKNKPAAAVDGGPLFRCATCHYHAERQRSATDDLREPVQLECRRYPPRAVPVPMGNGIGFMNVHPTVAPNHYCFEHPELKATLADEVIGILDGFGIDVDAVKVILAGDDHG